MAPKAPMEDEDLLAPVDPSKAASPAPTAAGKNFGMAKTESRKTL